MTCNSMGFPSQNIFSLRFQNFKCSVMGPNAFQGVLGFHVSFYKRYKAHCNCVYIVQLGTLKQLVWSNALQPLYYASSMGTWCLVCSTVLAVEGPCGILGSVISLCETKWTLWWVTSSFPGRFACTRLKYLVLVCNSCTAGCRNFVCI